MTCAIRAPLLTWLTGCRAGASTVSVDALARDGDDRLTEWSAASAGKRGDAEEYAR